MAVTETSAKRLAKLRLALWALVVIVAVVVIGIYATRDQRPTTTSTDYASAFGGAFDLIDRNRRTVSDQTLKGRPYAIFFGFTRCPDVCPTTLSRMATLRKQLGKDGDKFDIVFVSVDPKYDTPANIGQYVDLFGTPIIGLTGSDAQIAKAVKAFHVFYEKVPVPGGDYTIDHTASVFLMDREGKFVTTIAHGEDQGVALQKVRRIIEEG